MTRLKWSLFTVALLAGQWLVAQTVDEAKKFFYYERFVSARQTLNKVLAAKPNDPEASYWLSQVDLVENKTADAKKVLQNALNANSNHPLLIIGMGHVDLVENRSTEARQKLEVAMGLAKGKEIEIFNAVGRALADPKVKASSPMEARAADGQLAVEKLKAAVQLKGFKDPTTFVLMGDSYRKMLDGGGAVSSYNNALGIDPKMAAAYHKIGKVYLTQGKDQQELYLKQFNQAIALDPKYAPSYYELYYHYYYRDVNKAKEYFNLYKQNTDATPALEYEEASLLYASKDFKAAIIKANQLEQKDGSDARLHRLMGYSYNQLGDSVNALMQMELFFNQATPDQIQPDNYVMMAELTSKFPAKYTQAEQYFTRAILTDTIMKNKVDYCEQAAAMYKKNGNQQKVAEWKTNILNLKGANASKVDLYNAGIEHFKANNYPVSDSLFTMYKNKYPDETFGYYWCARSKWAIDSTLEKGLANADMLKLIEIAEKDKVKNKNILMTAYAYMAGYNANIAKDRDAAILFLEKILVIDPENKDAKTNLEILKNSKPSGTKPSGTKSGRPSPSPHP